MRTLTPVLAGTRAHSLTVAVEPLSLFPTDPAGHDSCVMSLIPPETLRKSTRSESCLVRVCLCKHVCDQQVLVCAVQPSYKCVGHISVWFYNRACFVAWLLGVR